MALNLPRVKPGDLIKADLLNSIMDALDSLDSKIGGGAASTAVKIDHLEPSDKIQVGQDLNIFGSNFQYSVGGQRVFFDNVPAVAYKIGSSDSLLIVPVPDLGTLPPLGRPVTVTASNLTTSDFKQITVVPLPNPIAGPVKVDPGDPVPNPVAQNSIADFPFTLTSGANLPVDVVVSPTLTGPNWQNLIQVLDATKNVLQGGTVPQLVPNVPTQIFVRINKVPDSTNGTQFTLSISVQSADGKVSGASGIASYTVNQSSSQDNSIHMQLLSPTITGNTLGVTSGQAQTVTFQLTVDNNDSYTISVSGSGNVTGWQFALNSPTPDQNSTTQRSQLPLTNTTVLNLKFGVFAGNGAKSGGQVQFKVQRQNATLAKTQTYNLQVN